MHTARFWSIAKPGFLYNKVENQLVGGVMAEHPFNNSHAICKDLTLSLTHSQLNFSPVIRSLHAPIKPQQQYLHHVAHSPSLKLSRHARTAKDKKKT